MPQIVRYSIPKSAYPRYEYSLRHHAGIIDRVLSLFQKLGARTQVKSLKFSQAEIDVLRLSPSSPIVDETTIKQRPTEKVEANTETHDSIESYLGETPLDEYNTRLLVISFDEVPEQIDTFRKHLKNTLFICQRSDTATSLKESIREEDDLIVTTTAELGIQIAIALERVVFRNIAKAVPALRSMSEDASVLCNLHDQLNCEAVNAMKTCAYTPFLKKLETEFVHGTCDYHSTPAYVRTTERSKVTVGNYMRYQVQKLSERLANTMSQAIIGIYKSIPLEIRDILPDDAYPDPTKIQRRLYDEFLVTLYKHIASEVYIEPRFETTEDLLRLLRSNKTDIISEIQRHTAGLPVVQDLKTHLGLIRDNRNEIADLVGEVRAMYNRSKVPQHERPISPVSPRKKLTKKVVDALFQKVPRIKGCCFKDNKLTIFLDYKGQELNQMNIRAKIKEILSQFEIPEFDINPVTESLKYYRKVGAQIKAHICGTLGGFAVMKQTPNDVLCGLVSNHATKGADDLLLVQNGDAYVKIGSMIKVKRDSQYNPLIDVAAAKILEDQLNLCDTSFKDTAGNNLPCRLYDPEKDAEFYADFLAYLPVHIYGATTRLGKGVIKMSEYFVNGPNEPDACVFILVEDVTDEKGNVLRFCKEGDSGAVICADDPGGEYVHVISMLIGCCNYDVIEKDSTKKGRYLTYTMTSALQKLEVETGYKFELCGQILTSCVDT